MRKAVIVKAKRTPVGKYGGMLKKIPPEHLAAAVINDVLRESSCPAEEINDVILGNVIGPGGNIARLSLLTAGLPVEIPGVTLDRQCGSGLTAINAALRLIQSGAGDVYLAGGVESASLAPWKMEKPASVYDLSPPKFYTRARFSPETIGDPDMGIAAENVARKYDVSRQDQDRYALHSHRKAVSAAADGFFRNEITPAGGDDSKLIRDECPRTDTSLEKLSKLKPVFESEGTVTAGNACPINDGAAIALVMSEEKAKALGMLPVLEFIDETTVGVDPNILGIGPVPAVRRLLKKQGLISDDLAYVEFNEAFASQVLASLRALNIPEDRVNLRGGALALGHPYGASGAILVTRLCAEAHHFRHKFLLATMGIGGGMGTAALFKSVV
ncbi:acetyl-CoA C-acetyltransferase [Scopulibacillus darangshiensis]|uniref:Acetyl-CoA C-acetyltransferase n=1 Tax=Scopulibacillus darangshiensis TaxID=442528 RepID=A0A4V2SNK4_9BACL|nr:thiolase family protein [Scopulibacillus darangshiensis]TCP31526.1 acetyl-CoA C-acetyltransferase [Scopulibacillus darangshiensis]